MACLPFKIFRSLETTLAWQLTTEEKLGPRLTSLYEVSGMRFMYTYKSIASTFAEKNCAKIC